MIDVRIPAIGESITSVFIARWIRKPGETVQEGEGLVEIDSDKASMEVPAPATGKVTEHLAKEGDEVPIGGLVARIDPSEGASASGSAAAAAPAAAQPAAASSTEAEQAAQSAVRAGPGARAEAHERGVDLGTVEGTGPRGRITRDDVRGAAEPAPPAASAPAPAAVAASPAGRVERVPMSPLRRTIARRLVEAQHTAAMLTTFNEVDMSGILALRKRYQDEFVKKHGVKLGFMSFFAKAAIEALKAFPSVNAEIDGTDIVYKRYYNLGVAVSGPKGLVVPVIRDADRLSFAETEIAIAEVAGRARDNKLTLQDFQDGTFTISNGGVFGSMMSTPILNPPQVGILGMHAMIERPVGVAGEIVLRPMMYVALSYDHRIIDGREAVGFLVRIKQCVEDPERILLDV